jgi:hypothetical protein
VSNRNDIWKALGIGMAAIFAGAALKAKQKVDDKQNGTSPEGRAFAAALNAHLAHTRSVRIPGALTRLDMDPNGEPVPGWNRAKETMPVLKSSTVEQVLGMCLDNEEYFKRFPNSIFCGWRVVEVNSAYEASAYWRLTQTVFFRIPENAQ